MDEILLSRIFALKVQADALKVDVDGMKAENIERIARDQSPTYSEINFQGKADQLRGIANELNDFGRG